MRPSLQKLKTQELIEGWIIDHIGTMPNGDLLITALSNDDNTTTTTFVLSEPEMKD